MSSEFKENQRNRAVKLIETKNPVFYGAEGGAVFMKKKRPFVLKESLKNIYQGIRGDVVAYIENNNISWWGGSKQTGHVLSSQIACFNHLFAIRNDKQAVLSILKSVSNDFVDVYTITSDKDNSAFIQFEAVSDKDHLNERYSSRGSNCTSIDALIYALHKDGKKWLIPIEWKYTEHYDNANKATEGMSKNKNKCPGAVKLVKPEYRDKVYDHYYDEHIHNHEEFCMEFPIISKDGKEKWIEHNCISVFDEDGKPKGRRGNNRDITGRKKIESEITRLSAAVEQSGNTIVITDINGDIVYVNPRFTELTGYTAQEAIGKNPRILNSGIQPKELYKRMWNSISNGNTWKGEFLNKTKDGRLFWENVTISPIKDSKGVIENYLGIKEDITLRKKSEEELLNYKNNLEEMVSERTKELEEKNKELSKFHDLFISREFRIKELRDKLKEYEKKDENE